MNGTRMPGPIRSTGGEISPRRSPTGIADAGGSDTIRFPADSPGTASDIPDLLDLGPIPSEGRRSGITPLELEERYHHCRIVYRRQGSDELSTTSVNIRRYNNISPNLPHRHSNSNEREGGKYISHRDPQRFAGTSRQPVVITRLLSG